MRPAVGGLSAALQSALLALALALPGAVQAAADEEAALIRIKTAYLFNFMKFVQWPAREALDQGASELVLCVMDDPQLARFAAAALRGRQVGDQPVRVATLRGPDDTAACSMLYAPGRRTAAPAGPVLTVAEGRAFAEGGGMIGFVVVQDRVRFVVNLKALREAGLAADAQLLSVAVEVIQ